VFMRTHIFVSQDMFKRNTSFYFSMKIPIYHYHDKCLRCKKEIDLYYPEELAFRYDIGNVKETTRNTHGGKTIGNICPYCNTYQDHRFVEHYFNQRCNVKPRGFLCVG